MVYRFDAIAWEWDGDAAWVFVTLPHELSDEIEASVAPRPGFGSVPVDVVVGETRWTTSLFPDKKAAAYLLPLKKAVRRAEGIGPGDTVAFELSLRPES